ncbi:MAG: hypothetical protein US74_C0012G0024 [Parcubacteria group bacterium GW2011_GWA2_38_13]|nr:MAG: hypothetical protein US74_C0012G0024 [Parcubacteria group bacterium GW2011_GWA2_38_13]
MLIKKSVIHIGGKMLLKDKDQVQKWLDSIEDPRVKEKLEEYIRQGKIPRIFIEDAWYDKARWEVYPKELDAFRNFLNLPFNSD